MLWLLLPLITVELSKLLKTMKNWIHSTKRFLSKENSNTTWETFFLQNLKWDQLVNALARSQLRFATSVHQGSLFKYMVRRFSKNTSNYSVLTSLSKLLNLIELPINMKFKYDLLIFVIKMHIYFIKVNNSFIYYIIWN